MEVIAFAAVILIWIGFAALLFFAQSSIDEMWTWFKDQSLIVQIPLAFLFLPWVIGASRAVGALALRDALGGLWTWRALVRPNPLLDAEGR